jgi:hypothetical protein
MFTRITISVPVLLLLTSGPVFAGQCSQSIAEVEKAITAKQEGSGPTLSKSTSTTDTSSKTSGSDVTEQSRRDTTALTQLQQAKELDQQGKEAECLQAIGKISGNTPQPGK